MNITYTFFRIVTMGVMLASFSACVDDYQDANPARPLDSPFFIMNADRDIVRSDQTVMLTLNVVDAPGTVESISFRTSDDLGAVSLDQASFDGVKGREAGSFQATFTPPQDAEGSVTITAVLADGQGENQKTHTESVQVVVNFACTGEDLSGTYEAVSCDDSIKTVSLVPGGGGFVISDLSAGTYGAALDVPATLRCQGGVLLADEVSVDTLTFSNIGGEVNPDGSMELVWTVSSPNTTPTHCATDLLRQ